VAPFGLQWFAVNVPLVEPVAAAEDAPVAVPAPAPEVATVAAAAPVVTLAAAALAVPPPEPTPVIPAFEGVFIG
jgi:hypothetical protein